jgi:acyl dehydratase
MAKIVIPGIDRLKEWVGKEVALTDWMEVTQAHIDEFADATGDHQWIHVDRERAARESPYGTTVAHGFLTLSLLPHFFMEAVEIQGARMGINYGLNRVRFTGPVPAGSRVRARFALASAEDIDHGVQAIWNVTVEREGEDKPVLIVEWITRRHR